MTKKADQFFNSTWQSLETHIAPEILCAPKTGGDPHGEWTPVHERTVKYLFRNVIGKPWANHLALIAAILSARRRDVWTVEYAVRILHARFSVIFPAFSLQTMDEWKVDHYLPLYLREEVVPQDSKSTRQSFLRDYTNVAKLVNNWLATLPSAEQQIYQRFVLPVVNPLAVEGLNRKKELEQQQRQHRKTETEAIVPHFVALRAESHFRYNRLLRLDQAYQQALAQVLPDHSNLPLEFSYDEGDPPQERFHFRIWDRRSFVLYPEHAQQYNRKSVGDARRGQHQYSEERNHLFLEFVNAERLEGEAPPEGFWFTELVALGLLGLKARTGALAEARQAWLHQWGYGEITSTERIAPFDAAISGLLTWADDTSTGRSNCRFMAEAQKRVKGIFVPVSEFLAAATFGLLGLDLLTTTGMRMNELMQLNLSPDCIIRLVDAPPPASRDQTPRIRYVLRLLPKGERASTLHNYGIGKESVRLIEKTAHMLCVHYKLQPGEPLPRISFSSDHARRHRFGKAPYLFQYNHQHISDKAITACIRFLLHGMIFHTSEGAQVVIKAHLLRHAFATFAVQVEGMSVDLVAKWLQQKNVEVTKYYSEMPEYMQVEQHASFLARLATQINIREAILRSPEEIAKQAEAAMRRVGMLVPVCGGDCTLDAYCPNQFDCIHCPAKAPDPEKRYQVEEKMRWAKERLTYYEQEGLVLEAEKMKQLLRASELEIREMEQIVAYRKDEHRVIQIQPRTKRS